MSDAEIYFEACKKQNPWAYQVEYPQIPDRVLPTNEDKLNLLREYDTVFLVDDSQSMIHVDQGATKSRWTTAMTWLVVLAVIAARYDRDGINIYFLNSRIEGKGLRTRQEVENAFNSVVPSGFTPTKTKINAILTNYLNELNGGLFHRMHWMQVKPLNLIVITDGA